MNRKLVLCCCVLMLHLSMALDLVAQTNRSAYPKGNGTTSGVWQRCNVDVEASLRGLCVFDDQIVWASGTAGTIIRSYDQGHTWRVERVQGAEKLDFRDLHVIDPNTVIAMTSGTPARIYRTENRGESWNVVFESSDPKVFLDSLSFLDANTGLVMGDPVDGSLFLLKSTDGGKTWSRVSDTPLLDPGEAGFAASGTNMTTWGNDRVMIALGGGESISGNDANSGAASGENTNLAEESNRKNLFSRILISDSSLKHWQAVNTPIPRHESGGIFSLVMIDANRGVAVGGDYKELERAQDHFALTTDGGKTWTSPINDQQQPLLRGAVSAPTGYRSCVVAWKRPSGHIGLLAVGPSGTDLSDDFGRSWSPVSETGFHAAQFSPSGAVGWGVGSHGRVARWQGD